jgi:hypothetical protein
MNALTSAKFRVAAVAMTLTLVMPPAVGAEVLLNVNVDSSADDYNPCTGEPILVYGTVHLLVTQTEDTSGGQRLHSHVNYQDVRALGLITGTTYINPGAGNAIVNATSGAGEATIQTRTQFIAPGQDSFYAEQHIHLTINANGDVTVSYNDVVFTCR